ncbi:hypothetical protein PG985_011155 [Apiospora marii]|uniref:uncharacterized protein n=1 Tax=Apiospora marii TaxID=335849 RepID=UPI00312D4FD4
MPIVAPHEDAQRDAAPVCGAGLRGGGRRGGNEPQSSGGSLSHEQETQCHGPEPERKALALLSRAVLAEQRPSARIVSFPSVARKSGIPLEHTAIVLITSLRLGTFILRNYVGGTVSVDEARDVLEKHGAIIRLEEISRDVAYSHGIDQGILIEFKNFDPDRDIQATSTCSAGSQVGIIPEHPALVPNEGLLSSIFLDHTRYTTNEPEKKTRTTTRGSLLSRNRITVSGSASGYVFGTISISSSRGINDVLGFKNDKAAKDAFDYTCMKLANMQNSMGAGPSTPDGKGGENTPAPSAAKKATPARAQRKRKQAAKEEVGDESPSKRARIGGDDDENEEVYDETSHVASVSQEISISLFRDVSREPVQYYSGHKVGRGRGGLVATRPPVELPAPESRPARRAANPYTPRHVENVATEAATPMPSSQLPANPLVSPYPAWPSYGSPAHTTSLLSRKHLSNTRTGIQPSEAGNSDQEEDDDSTSENEMSGQYNNISSNGGRDGGQDGGGPGSRGGRGRPGASNLAA